MFRPFLLNTNGEDTPYINSPGPPPRRPVRIRLAAPRSGQRTALNHPTELVRDPCGHHLLEISGAEDHGVATAIVEHIASQVNGANPASSS